MCGALAGREKTGRNIRARRTRKRGGVSVGGWYTLPHGMASARSAEPAAAAPAATSTAAASAPAYGKTQSRGLTVAARILGRSHRDEADVPSARTYRSAYILTPATTPGTRWP
jgi:hypothetical protein